MEKVIDSETKQSLQEIFEQLDAAANPKLEILNLILENARKKNPELSGILLACAIPRKFDHHIIGLLRNSSTVEENRHFLEMVNSNSFVIKTEEGYSVYRDDTREVILEDWKSSEEKQRQFDDINNKLIRFYEDEYTKIRQSELDLVRVSPLMIKVNLARYRRMASQIEMRILFTLLEALYQKLLGSPADGFAYFRTQFHEQEEIGHIMVCKALISATRDFLLRLPKTQQAQQQFNWLDYFELRIMRQLTPYDLSDVEERLQQLSETTDLDKQLQIWILNELETVKESQQKLKEAVQIFETLLSLTEQTTEDVYNLPLYYSNLGGLYWTLGELDKSIEYYQAAIQKSEKISSARTDMQVISRLNLSGVYCEVGQWDKALETGIEAMILTRTQFTDNKSLQSLTAHRFMGLLLPYDLAASDSAAAEYHYFIQDNEQSRLDGLDKQLGLLDSFGRNRQLNIRLKRLRNDVELSDHAEQFKSLLLFREAYTYEGQGFFHKAILKYNELNNLQGIGPIGNWTKAAALTNRGRLLANKGMWEAATQDFRSASELWKSYGNEVLTAFINVVTADMLRLRGMYPEAQAELNKAAKVLSSGNRSFSEDYYFVQGDICLSGCNWKNARKFFKKALAMKNDRNDHRTALKILNKLCETAIAEGNWALAARFADQAKQKCDVLASFDAYEPSDSHIKANKNNVEGMRLFCEGSDINLACEKFRSASEEFPQNFWYQLNLSFAGGLKGNWLGAAQSMETAIILANEKVHKTPLYICWRDYLVKYAENLQRNHEYIEAIEIIKEALRKLEPLLKNQELLELRVRLGDYLVYAGLIEEARLSYSAGLQLALSMHLENFRLRFLVRQYMIDTFDDRLRDAISGMHLLLEDPGTDSLKIISSALTEIVDLIQTPLQFHAYNELLRSLIASEITNEDQLTVLNTTLLYLVQQRYLPVIYTFQRLKPEPNFQQLPYATPIALDIAQNLAPDDNVPGIQWMIETGFPDIRSRILKESGVRIPGVRIRTNANNPQDGYFHSLFDIPLWLYQAYEKKKFCPDAELCRKANLRGLEADNYGPGGGKGMWLDESEWSKPEASELILLNPYEYMTAHTEYVIREHMVLFFGTEELQKLITDWKEGVMPFDQQHFEKEDRKNTAEAAIPDDQAFRQLLSVLHSLLRENIPILNLDIILNEFITARNEAILDISEIVQKIRMALRKDLPGRKDHMLISIPEKLEDTLAEGMHRQDGKLFYALPAEQVQKFLSEIRLLIPYPDEPRHAIVVSSAELRPLVSSILALEFPGIPVLAKQELIEPEEKK